MANIKIENLKYYYPETQKPALNEVDLFVPAGQFVIVLGNSGSGKSTLLRTIAGSIPGFYNGSLTGKIFIDSIDISLINRRDLVRKVGIVFQDPEGQMVMMNVEQEIAFGLENLNFPPNLMKRRVMEMSSSLGLAPCLDGYVADLSGGQKQKVALAGVLAMQPEILLLDEPTSQLDPVAAEELLNVVRRLNEDNGITVIMIEQRLERCCHLADRILVMEDGGVAADFTTENMNSEIWMQKMSASYLPPLPRLFANAGFRELPLTVKQGRHILNSCISAGGFNNQAKSSRDLNSDINNRKKLIDIQNLWFIYPNTGEILKNVNLTIADGDFIALLGGNGTGKSTLLKNINGLLKPSRGNIRLEGKDTREMKIEELSRSIAYLSQDPNDYLFMPCVREELEFTMKNLGLRDTGYLDEILKRFKLEQYGNCNPRDLSTGERQRVALASVLMSRPKLLLLDEPTRGFDYHIKEELGKLLLELNDQGTTVLLVTHDIDFAAEYAQDICLMFDGKIIERGNKYEVLQHSTFYSSQIGKLFNNIVDNVITVGDGINAILELNARI